MKAVKSLLQSSLLLIFFCLPSFAIAAGLRGGATPGTPATNEYLADLELARAANAAAIRYKPAPSTEGMGQEADYIYNLEQDPSISTQEELLRKIFFPGKPGNEVGLGDSLGEELVASSEAFEKELQLGMCSPEAKAYFAGLKSSHDFQDACAGAPDGTLADLSIESLLSNKVVVDESQAKRLIRNLTVRFLKAMEEGVKHANDNGNIGKVFEKMLARGSFSVPLYSYTEMLNMRKPHAGTSESKLSLMERQSLDRVKDSEWAKQLATLPQEAINREIAYMQAIQLRNQYYAYRQNERVEALLAVIATNLTEQGIKVNEALSAGGQ